jgi:hypothetical protein
VVEKAHNVTVSVFGITLAVWELILGGVIIYFAINFNLLISGLMSPIVYGIGMLGPAGFLGALFNATSALLIVGGIYVLTHAIKRLIDNIFKSYIASKQ